jgi:hypothetical protein
VLVLVMVLVLVRVLVQVLVQVLRVNTPFLCFCAGFPTTATGSISCICLTYHPTRPLSCPLRQLYQPPIPCPSDVLQHPMHLPGFHILE